MITPLVPLADGSYRRNSPVAGARIIGGLVPCNVIAEEILTDHPDRYRAMIVEAGNPVHSLADSKRFREALDALDTVVVIDVAMTETARAADYVLPAATQYEKAEATFFNFEFPENYFHLRPPLMAPPEGPLPEAEIHARLVEALGILDPYLIQELRQAAEAGMPQFTMAFGLKVMGDAQLAGLAPVILYRALGPVLPEGMAEGAVLWGLAMRCATKSPKPLERAGFGGGPQVAGNKLFQAILNRPSGTIFSVDTWDEVFGRIGTADGKIQLALDDLLAEMSVLEDGPEPQDEAFPLVLSAGERRSYTANTIVRQPHWRKKDGEGALRMSPVDAESLGLTNGDRARLSTARGSTEVTVEVTSAMQAGHISLPNGMGLDHTEGDDDGHLGGVAPNELTALEARDPFVGTPWHKHVPARVEALSGVSR